jgi:hypothetical protein
MAAAGLATDAKTGWELVVSVTGRDSLLRMATMHSEGGGVMRLGRIRKAIVLVAVSGVVGLFTIAAARGQDEDPTCKVTFLIQRDSNSKPIRAASVVLHPVTRKGKQERGGFELKTDNDGKTEFEGVPYGKMRIQVLAQGFQTYGEDYVIDKPNMDIVVKLKRPAEQYSIYGDQANAPKKEEPKDQKPQ